MSTYDDLLGELDPLESEFAKCYKRVNKTNLPRESLVIKHLNDLIELVNNYREILRQPDLANDLTLSQVNNITQRKRNLLSKLGNAFSRTNRELVITQGQNIPKIQEIEFGTDTEEEYQQTDSESDTESDPESEAELNMDVPTFLNAATKIVNFEFDGKAENLQRFIDALTLLNTPAILGEHQALAITIIKTKLAGSARSLITNEDTIPAIIATLRDRIKGESSQAILAKIENVKQGSKSANLYIKEVEDLTKQLENAYISEQIPSATATTMSTQAAVKAVAKNATNDNVKLIVQAGNFGNMNELVAKFVTTATEAQSPASILFTRRLNTNGNNGNRTGNFRSNFRGNHTRRGNNRGRGNNNNNNGGSYNNNYNRGTNNNNNNRNNNNQGHRNNGSRPNNRGHVFQAQAGQGNGQPANQQHRLGADDQF